MKVIIVGAGVVGFEIAKQLIIEGCDVIVIEKDRERYKYVDRHLDCTTINDSGTNIQVLRQANTEDADFFISVTESDEINMILCATVSSIFEKPCKIARIRNVEYQNLQVIKNLGIDYIVSPELEAFQSIINIIDHGVTSDIHALENTHFQIRNIYVSDDSYFYNKSLIEIKKSLNKEFLIIGIIRDFELIIPKGNTVVQENDVLYLLSNEHELNEIFQREGKPKKNVRKILVVGGNFLGRKILSYLVSKNKIVTMIDKSFQVCQEIQEEFPDVLTLTADITDESIFIEENLHRYDLIITVTNNQELNILTAVYAKAIGIKRAMGLVGNSNYLKIANRLGLDAIISPKLSMIDKILQIVRQDNTKSVHSIFDGNTQIIDMVLSKTSRIIGKQLKDLDFPPDALVISITRGQKSYIPNGNFQFQEEDIVSILVKTTLEAINSVKNLL